ncbi:MAG: hypothetical protein KBC47_04795, partial [Candidatus Peribacteraceae bacterium]|nr:hypothetical protein [Candidatus Peribacteraceae bacterium]
EEYTAAGLTAAEATMLVDSEPLRTRFDAVKNALQDAKRASSIVLTQMPGFLTKHSKTLSDAPSADALCELADAMKSGKISTNAGKDVLEKMVATGTSAATIIKDEGMGQVADDATLTTMITEAIAANPKAVQNYKEGKTAALGAIVGAVMKQTKGQADAAKVNALLLTLIA